MVKTAIDCTQSLVSRLAVCYIKYIQSLVVRAAAGCSCPNKTNPLAEGLVFDVASCDQILCCHLKACPEHCSLYCACHLEVLVGQCHP